MSIAGYAIVEVCDEFQQLLCLRIASDTPELGVLDWGYKGETRAVFETYKAARAAIARTGHYRKAFGRESGSTEMPNPKNCVIVKLKWARQ